MLTQLRPRIVSLKRTKTLLLALSLCLVGAAIVVNRTIDADASSMGANYADIAEFPASPAAPPAGPDASTGTFTQDCGRNERGHHNADNVVVSPGLVGGAHHIHDYVGNISVNARSTERSLAGAGTTCVDGDRSSYFWPVLRRLDRPGADARAHGGGTHGNEGEIVRASSVSLEFLGNPAAKVLPMPRFLRLMTGDPVAATTADDKVRARWGCTGGPGRHSADRYPLCPAGSGPTRTLEFPSCWDGLHEDSRDHRTHAVFPAANGVCPPATFPVPRLRVTLAYDIPPGVPYAVDSFPEQRRHPKTDHGMFIHVMSDRQRAAVAECLNEGRRCEAG
ncbi:DUF1996 domain-containing protein [Streptomyces sp. CAU 1734]|uniref:DUF1996 domain-containing protein n=1 Tax=Streptomyces sp. CAU 1734 TaxID=3140360 RepID=UPI0032608C21